MRPPRIAEAVVALLTPPACREHVLGDLQERCSSPGQYARDALSTLPGVIYSQVRRTTDPQLFVIETFVVLLALLAAAWSLGGADSIVDRVGLRFGIPAASIVLTFILAEAYARPGRLSVRRVVLRAAFAVSLGFLSQAVLLVVSTDLALPRSTMLLGGSTSLLLLSALRMAFPPRRVTLQPARDGGGATMPSRDIEERWQEFRKTMRRSRLSLLVAAGIPAAFGAWACLGRSATDFIAGGMMITIAVYLVWQIARKNQTPGGGAVSREFLRGELERQRDALRSMWWWFIGPFLGALILFAARLALTHPEVWYNVLPFTALSLVWAVALGKLSGRAASKLQREIDTL
jgi:hypothetical protein